MRISKQDRDNLIVIAVMAFIVAFCVAVFFGVRLIPFKWVTLVIVLCEVGFLIPQICKMYYGVYGMDVSWKAWIPVYNIISVFNGAVAILTVGALVLTAAMAFFVFAPAEWYVNLIPVGISLSFPAVTSGLFIISVLILDVLVGAGYTGVSMSVISITAECYGVSKSKLSMATCAMLFVPVVRVCGLTQIYSNLVRLKTAKYVVGQDTTQEIELEEVE